MKADKRIKTVGSAVDRFDEDRLRILRAVRFAARFDSNLDQDIVNSLYKNNSLEGISVDSLLSSPTNKCTNKVKDIMTEINFLLEK